jgi:tRNA(Ile)-lysidine synthase
MAVLAVLARSLGKVTVVVAHLDHGLRGRRGAVDAAFVKRLSVGMGFPFHGGRVRIAKRGASLEAAARDARYAFLSRVARRMKAKRIAVAHTADDQAETVLHRLCRGGGIRGLAAMAPSRTLDRGGIRLIRPLLSLTRDEVLEYLRERGLSYRIDETNRSCRWTRNRIRHRVLPLLSRDVHPGAGRALARFASQAADLQRFISEQADDWERRACFRWSGRRGRAACDVLTGAPPPVRAEIWIRALERLGGTAASASDVDALEEVMSGHRKAFSWRGGRILIRRMRNEIRFDVRDDS